MSIHSGIWSQPRGLVDCDSAVSSIEVVVPGITLYEPIVERNSIMLDLLYIAAGCLFFALGWALTKACEKL